MNFEKIILVVVLSLGAIQGLIYGFLLLRSGTSNRVANRLLASMLFLLSYRLIVETMLLFGLGEYDVWYHFMMDLNWVYGPLIFLYVKAQVIPNYNLPKSDWIHFLPVGIQIICSNFVRAQNFYWDGTRESLSWLGYWGYVVWMNYPSIYLIASLLIIGYSFKAAVLIGRNEDQDRITYEKQAWLKKVLYTFRIYFLLVFLVLLTDLLWYDISFSRFYYYFEQFYYYPMFIGFAGIVYWLGITGFHKKDLPNVIVKKAPEVVPSQNIITLANQLKQLMEQEQVYRNPAINLQHLSGLLNTKPYLLSKCLKTVFNQRFNDYINLYRIGEVESLLKNPEFQHLSLLGIAFEAGFNSKASFYRAVQKHLGISPSELKKRVQDFNGN